MADNRGGALGRMMPFGVIAAAASLASSDAVWAGVSDFSPPSYVGSLDPGLVWEILLFGFLLLCFAGSLVLWTVTRLRRVRRSQQRRRAFINSVLNNLGQGLVMVDARRRVMFCNDRFLDMYGLTRRDITPGMTGPELLELRRQRGTLTLTAEQYYQNAGSSDGYVSEQPDGRVILIRHQRLPNGGTISTHDNVTDQRQLSKQLVRTKAFLESVIDNIPVCVAAKSIEDGRYILANRAFEKFSKLNRDQIVGHLATDIYSSATAERVTRVDALAVSRPDEPLRTELVVDRGGRKRTLSTIRVVARNEHGQPAFIIALFEDVTDRLALSLELEQTKKFLELIVDHIPLALTVQNVSDGRYLLVNQRAEAILNRPREEAIGLSVAELFQPKEAQLVADRDEIAIKRGNLVIEEQPLSTPEGLRLFLTRRIAIPNEEGAPRYLIKTHVDVTDRRQAEARNAHMAYHDGLTDLPNRAAFMKSLTQMIEACGEQDQFAVLSIDLDGLKEINDVFGHGAGDQLLIALSRSLQNIASGGVVARLGGDEFGLIIDGEQPRAATELAKAIATDLASGFEIDGKAMRVGVTTGIAVFPQDGADAAALLSNANAALFRAKAKMRGSINLFDPEMDRQMRDRRVLHQDLFSAIRRNEISLHFQPQARTRRSIGDEDVLGFEALARWHHPTRGFVPPSDFIPLAEESGLIADLGAWILREACREAASWDKPLQVAVNLSPAQFQNGDVVSLVHGILLETGLKPSRLELEITEGVLIEDFERGLSLLRRLTALGVRIAMDDFGSGYSSLTYLQAFPFDKIKIDRAFVSNLGRGPQSAAIVRAVIGLGQGLGVSIVAEGVETQQQLDFLVDEQCDVIQGYLLGKPAPIEAYAHLVRPGSAAAARKAG